MHDLRWIRENAATFDAEMARRGTPAMAGKLLELDERRRASQTRLQEMQARRNEASRAIGNAKKKGEAADALMAEVAALKESMAAAEEGDRAIGEELESIVAGLPNVAAPDVPTGEDESANQVVRTIGAKAEFDFEPRQHFELFPDTDLIDFETAAQLSGSRFVVLRGAVARLHRVLGQYMIERHVSENDYTEVVPPYLVRDHVLYGTGQLPKFGEDLFRTTTEHSLIPTAEVPLTNLVAGQILEASALPMRVTALTPCFRSEAGAAGRDTRGMLRQHQFDKCELVSVTAQEQSDSELERMLRCAEGILQALGLAYRVVLLSSGDMGFAARKTYDLEVWLPGQQAYREISSCSNCWDFQARRMRGRYRLEGEKGTRFLHTLNGSGVAVGRALIAVLETYQRADGSVVVPEVLRPFMGGLEEIRADG